MDTEGDKDEDMTFWNTKREMKAVYGHSNFESSDNEHYKSLHVMFKGSWDITSRRIVNPTAPAPNAVLHHKWMET
jgi:hypothetical protein